MWCVISNRSDGTTCVYGAFANEEAANYFVSEYPHSEDKQTVAYMRPIEDMGICPVSGDGTYRYFNK